ncbi:MAG: glycosyl transferase [Geobacter sp.]|nr:MAG: glycosyl transferase [Geobacter sp.]
MVKKKTIAIIGTNGLPGRYGGWDQLLNHLTDNLKENFSFIVYTSFFNAQKGLKKFNDAELKIIPLKANGIQSIPYDIVSMIHAIYKRYDILLVLGTSGCIFLPIARLLSKKIILNIDGAEWKRGKWGRFAKAFLLQSEKFGVNYSDIVISDNIKIQEYVLEKYKINSELIEYGGDNAKYVPMKITTQHKYSILPDNYAFKVCRIEPENNLDMILAAFKNTTLKLVVIGNWNFSSYGIELRKKYNNSSNLILLDPIYEQAELDELRGNCCLYIHGHSVGGTNPSLVEAMNLGLCCVVFNVPYNIETTENSAIYFRSKEELEAIVNNYLENKIDKSPYKLRMKEIAKRRYLWSVVTDKYQNLFLESK